MLLSIASFTNKCVLIICVFKDNQSCFYYTECLKILHLISSQEIPMQSRQTKKRNVDQQLCYKLEQWKKIGTFDIMNNNSKYVTLIQLMDSVGNVNHALV